MTDPQLATTSPSSTVCGSHSEPSCSRDVTLNQGNIDIYLITAKRDGTELRPWFHRGSGLDNDDYIVIFITV